MHGYILLEIHTQIGRICDYYREDSAILIYSEDLILILWHIRYLIFKNGR